MINNSLSNTNISYRYSFEKYTRSYLPSFSLEEKGKLDLLSNRNAKFEIFAIQI